MKIKRSTWRLVVVLWFVTMFVLVFALKDGLTNSLVDEFDGNAYTPTTTYGFKEVPFSTSNKGWFLAYIAANALDIWSTQYALDNGCTEGNPLYGSDPSAGEMILIKTIVATIMYVSVEYLSSSETLVRNRDLVYGTGAIMLTGISLYNVSQVE